MAERQKSVRLKRVELRNSLKSCRLTKSRPRLGNVTTVASDILTMIDLVQPKVLPVPHVELRDISQKSVVLHKNRTSRNSRKTQKFTHKVRPKMDKSHLTDIKVNHVPLVTSEVSDSDTGSTDCDYVYAVQKQEMLHVE